MLPYIKLLRSLLKCVVHMWGCLTTCGYSLNLCTLLCDYKWSHWVRPLWCQHWQSNGSSCSRTSALYYSGRTAGNNHLEILLEQCHCWDALINDSSPLVLSGGYFGSATMATYLITGVVLFCFVFPLQRVEIYFCLSSTEVVSILKR